MLERQLPGKLPFAELGFRLWELWQHHVGYDGLCNQDAAMGDGKFMFTHRCRMTTDVHNWNYCLSSKPGLGFFFCFLSLELFDPSLFKKEVRLET